MKFVLFTLVISLLNLSVLFSQTNTTSSGNWSNGGNWSSGVPGSGSTATITNNIDIDTDITINDGNYTVNGGSMIDDGLSRDLLIQGIGTFDINGNVTFLGNMELINMGIVTVRSGDTLRIGGNVILRNNANIFMETGSVLIVTGNLEMRNNVIGEVNGQIFVAGDFTGKNGSTISGEGNLQVSGETNFSNGSTVFGSSTDCIPGPCEYGTGVGLPIELISFEASFDNSNTLKIKWVTATEINNDYFTVSYSIDGREFNELLQTKGSGNSNVTRTYEKKISGVNYDRIYLKLRQTDFDGKYEEFSPIFLKKNNSNSLTFYPNPFSNYLIIENEKLQLDDFMIMNLQQQNLSHLVEIEQISSSKIRLNTEKLESGYYLVRIGNIVNKILKSNH